MHLDMCSKSYAWEVNTNKVLDKRQQGISSAFTTKVEQPKKSSLPETSKLATSAKGRHIKLITFMQNVLHNLPC